jgi:CheY-like chemotaxis protein
VPAAAPTAPAADATAQAAADARASARAKAERVIAAEAARREAAIQKAQALARADAERRAAEAARAAASLASTLPSPQLPKPERGAPVVAPALGEQTVPLARAALAAVREPAEPAVPKTAAQTLVMLVDDSKMVRVKSSRLLAAHEFQVVTAIDGVDALKQLEHCRPDLIITDVDMPNMDGFGLVAALRGDARTREIPLVMITSAEERHREEALRVGVGLVMGKPYDEAALVAHIRSFRFLAPAGAAESLACA